MSNKILDSFIDKKKAESAFVSLEDGESCRITELKDMKLVTKVMFGEEKEILRLIVDVETIAGLKSKNFDNNSQKFALELRNKGVGIGSGFTITRHGLQTKTLYEISDVTNPLIREKELDDNELLRL